MTFLVKNFALASLAAAALVACGGGGDGGSSNGTPATTSQSATYTTSFSIGDTWQIKLEGVTVNNVAQTSGNFIGTVLVGGYAAFPTGTPLTGTWSYSDGEIELKLNNANDKPVVIAFTAEQPTPSKEGETAAVIQIASFTEDGVNKTVAAIPSPERAVSDFTPGEIPLLTEDTTYHHVSLRFKRSTGEFDATSSETGVVTKDGNTLSLGKNNNFVFGEATDGFYPAYQQKSNEEFAPRGLLYAAGNGNVNFDYIDDTLTGMSYLVNLKQSESIANGYSGNWKCTSLIDPKLYAQLKITTATAISGQSVEITDFYNGKKVGGPHTEKFEAGSDGLIQLRDGNELTNTFVYPISENYFIVNDKTGEEPSARFLSCVPTAAQPDTGNGGNDSGSDGDDSGFPAETDPRYGHGGKVLSSKNVVKEEDIEADSGYNVTPAGFFVFQVSNLNDFATGQYIKAAKIAKSSTDFGYAFGLDFFSASTADGWKTSSWSYKDNDAHYGQAFLNGQLLTTCKVVPQQPAGSELQIIAFSEEAEVVKDLAELNGKTFTEYSCGVDSEDWYDFTNNNKTPFAYTSSFSIQNGLVTSMDKGDEVNTEIPVTQLFSGELFTEQNDGDEWEWSTYATPYKLGDKYFIIMKDKDNSHKQNLTTYGLNLAVSN